MIKENLKPDQKGTLITSIVTLVGTVVTIALDKLIKADAK